MTNKVGIAGPVYMARPDYERVIRTGILSNVPHRAIPVGGPDTLVIYQLEFEHPIDGMAFLELIQEGSL